MLRLTTALLTGLWLAVVPQTPLVVRDLDGHAWSPLSPAAGEVNLVVFVGATCPISARYSPEIDRILRDYGAKGVHAWLVYADPQIAPAAVRANLKEFHPSATVPAIIDTGFRLTAAVDVNVTPEVAIYTHSGRVYRGRIDDVNDAIGQSRRAAAHHDLRDALDAVLAGRPVPNPETKAIGCFIERTVK
ncbi:MAG: hypothetical protein ACHQO8_07190 [Vicinamibacterales bacterium]